MSRQNRSKLNRLLREWPQGTVSVYPWLNKKGFDYKLVQKYQLNDWLASIGSGAVIRSGDKVDWHGGVYALQKQLSLSVHPGGKTALQLLGLAHYLPLGGGEQVTLLGEPGEIFPRWFLNYKWGSKLDCKNIALFAPHTDLGFTKLKIGVFEIEVSSAERAMLELLYLVPGEESFDEAQKLMEGLATLRPSLTQSLLERCTSIKVKRLFMFMAEAANHAWVKRLKLSRVGLGEGKRVIVEGGRFDSKYKITVPRTNE